MSGRWALALHGGAGVKSGRDYERAEACLAVLARDGGRRLADGDVALNVVEDLTAAMEDSGLFVAGRGSAPCEGGTVELDAALMDGRDGAAGAVAGLIGFPAPVRVARRVMQATSHVLLAGQGAADFAGQQGFEPIEDIGGWLRKPDGFDPADLDEGHGTVGAVALDLSGALAAATSTGGVYGKRPGRVGDTPLIGSGTWADERIAVSCTGQGEAFIRAAAAHDLAARIAYAGAEPLQAAEAVLARVAALGGDGGLIAVTAEGDVITPFNTDGMKRAVVAWNRALTVGSIGGVMRSPRNNG